MPALRKTKARKRLAPVKGAATKNEGAGKQQEAAGPCLPGRQASSSTAADSVGSDFAWHRSGFGIPMGSTGPLKSGTPQYGDDRRKAKGGKERWRD
jgi:hypothetical protein